jgi:hypothetical protein
LNYGFSFGLLCRRPLIWFPTCYIVFCWFFYLILLH